MGDGPVPASPTDVAGPAPVVLPGEDVLLPPGVDGGGSWIGIDNVPAPFDPDTAYDTPQALVDAFAQAVVMSAGGGAVRPRVELVVTEDLADGRALLIVNATGIADDALAGTQYAMVVAELAGRWGIVEIYARPLCTRGVAGGRCL